jgi:hypothetical protein
LIDDAAGVVALVLEDHRRDVVVLADGKAGGNAVLTHFLTSIDLVTGGRIAVTKTNGGIPAARRQWPRRRVAHIDV